MTKCTGIDICVYETALVLIFRFSQRKEILKEIFYCTIHVCFNYSKNKPNVISMIISCTYNICKSCTIYK